MEISFGVTLVVLLSAFIHASWNAILKSGSDKLMDATLISFFGVIFSLIAIVFLPVINDEAWPYVAVSSVIHVVYFISLANSYSHNDISHAYPLMRGLAPPFVALFAYLIVGEQLPIGVYVGILLISLGVLLPGRIKKENLTLKSVFFILLTAFSIVCYTITDGMGVRASGNAASYVTYTSIVQGIILIAIMLFYSGHKKICDYASKRWVLCAIAGGVSILAYGLVLWAMERAPIGVVSALRETSVVFGTLIGIYFFKEGFGKKRMATAILICIGAILIKVY